MNYNLYHILNIAPFTDSTKFTKKTNILANKLYESGLIKIDADDRSNFIKFTDPELRKSLFFSNQEIKSKSLLPYTQKKIIKIYQERGGDIRYHLQKTLDYLHNKVKLLTIPTLDLQMKIIYLLIQSTHPIIFEWILLEKTNIFISFGHSIGDVMDINNWKHNGKNSGMQSSNGIENDIFISIGGDPFRKRYNTEYGDGEPAIARLFVVGGQELGHYADIKRDNYGNHIGRHSANINCTKASTKSLYGRRKDLEITKSLLLQLNKMDLQKLVKYDEDIIFYRKHNVSTIKYFYTLLYQKIYKWKFTKEIKKNKELEHLLRYTREKYMGLMIYRMIQDMLFNLAPVADVYSRDNKEEEEAISCIEALARVPQQVNKWGYLSTKATMKNLYQLYYKEVIPDLIERYENITQNKYEKFDILKKETLYQKISRLFSKDPLKEYRKIK